MTSLVEVFDRFREGGVFMYPLLLLLLATPAVAVLLAIPYAAKLRAPAVLYVLSPAGLVLLGALGTLAGTSTATSAMEFVSSDQLAMIAAAGWAAAQTPLELGLYGAALAAATTAGLGAASVSVGAGTEASWTWGEASVALAVGGLFAVAAVFYGTAFEQGTLLPGLILGGGAIALGAASLRRSEGAPGLGRVAEGRLAIAALVLVAVLCACEAERLDGWQEAFRAWAYAEPSQESSLFMAAVAASRGATWTGVIAVVGALLAAVGPLYTSLHGLLDRRGALAAAALAAVLLGAWGSFGLASWRSSTLWEVAQGGILAGELLGALPEARAIDGPGIDTTLVGGCLIKPEATGWSQRSLYPSLRRGCGDDWTPMTQPIGAEEDLLLAVPPTLPASRLSTWQWGGAGRNLNVLIDRNQPDEAGPRRFGAMTFTWRSKTAASAGRPSTELGIQRIPSDRGAYMEEDSLFLIEGDNGTVMGFTPGHYRFFQQEMKTRTDLDAALFYVGGQTGFRSLSVTLVPGSSWTVGDLVKWCATAQDPDRPSSRSCVLSEETPDELGKRLNAIWSEHRGGEGVASSDEDTRSEDIRQIGMYKYAVSKPMLEAQFGDEAALARMGRVVPHLGPDGEVDGYRIFAIRSDALPARLGFKNGDIVHSFNGRALTSTEDPRTAFHTGQNERTFQLEVTRRGQRITLEYELR